MISFQKWCTMFYDCLTATYQWLREERISGQVCQFSDMKQFVCHQVAFMEKFCGRIGQVIVIYHPILCYSPTLQPYQLPSKMGLHNKEFVFEFEFVSGCLTWSGYLMNLYILPLFWKGAMFQRVSKLCNCLQLTTILVPHSVKAAVFHPYSSSFI